MATPNQSSNQAIKRASKEEVKAAWMVVSVAGGFAVDTSKVKLVVEAQNKESSSNNSKEVKLMICKRWTKIPWMLSGVEMKKKDLQKLIR